jgi:hypothetical protein
LAGPDLAGVGDSRFKSGGVLLLTYLLDRLDHLFLHGFVAT